MSQTFLIDNQAADYFAGEHDIIFDNVGNLIILEGVDKLVADVKKILATERNYFYSNYGTQLSSFIGTNVNPNTIKQVLAQNITNSLVYLTYLQGEQAKYQALDAGETIEKIVQVSVTYLAEISPSPEARTSFRVDIIIQNALGANVSISSTMRVT